MSRNPHTIPGAMPRTLTRGDVKALLELTDYWRHDWKGLCMCFVLAQYRGAHIVKNRHGEYWPEDEEDSYIFANAAEDLRAAVGMPDVDEFERIAHAEGPDFLKRLPGVTPCNR
jgi:hypothetical protein